MLEYNSTVWDAEGTMNRQQMLRQLGFRLNVRQQTRPYLFDNEQWGAAVLAFGVNFVDGMIALARKGSTDKDDKFSDKEDFTRRCLTPGCSGWDEYMETKKMPEPTLKVLLLDRQQMARLHDGKLPIHRSVGDYLQLNRDFLTLKELRKLALEDAADLCIEAFLSLTGQEQ